MAAIDLPGPGRTVPVSEIRTDPLRFLREMRDSYGDLSTHMTEEGPVFNVNRPDLARVVLRERRHSFSKLGTPDDQMLTPLLGRGLLTSEGEQWKRQRKLAQPAFEPWRVASFDTLMTDAALELVERWRPEIGGEPRRVDHDFSSLTLAIVARAVLGAEIGTGGGFGKAIDAANRFMGHYMPLEPGPERDEARTEYLRAVAMLDRIVNLLVDGRRVTGVRDDDLLDRLLHPEDGGAPFERRELRDQVLTMLMAGHETTGKALTWTSYLLDAHRDVGDALREELARVLGERVPTADDLDALPLCRQVVQEAMRLYPPVWLISRRAVEDVELDGHVVPAGALICVSPYLLHRHPDHWDEPERFDPSRFDAQRSEGRHPFSYLPFSEGPRQCVGRHFALTEAQLAVATLFSRVDLRLVPGHPVEPEALVTLRPRDGMLMTLHAP